MNRSKHPRPKPVMVINDYPIQTEIDADEPYSAASNFSFLHQLHRNGINQLNCHLTYLSYNRPTKENYDWNQFFRKGKSLSQFEIDNEWTILGHQKDLYVNNELWDSFTDLLNEIRLVEPKIIIITGKWGLFFLTGAINYTSTQGKFNQPKPLGGLSKFRASIMTSFKDFCLPKAIIYPVLPPVTKQRDPSKVPIMAWDMQKLGIIYKSLIEQTKTIDGWIIIKKDSIIIETINTAKYWFEKLLNLLKDNPTIVAIDIETKFNTIDCVGLAWSKDFGICLPFLTELKANYWTESEELLIVDYLNKILTHPNLRIAGQNFSYDSQYFHKFHLLNLHPAIDTMIANHVIYNYLEKNLAFLASIYCDQFIYWKDMTKHNEDSEGVK